MFSIARPIGRGRGAAAASVQTANDAPSPAAAQHARDGRRGGLVHHPSFGRTSDAAEPGKHRQRHTLRPEGVGRALPWRRCSFTPRTREHCYAVTEGARSSSPPPQSSASGAARRRGRQAPASAPPSSRQNISAAYARVDPANLRRWQQRHQHQRQRQQHSATLEQMAGCLFSLAVPSSAGMRVRIHADPPCNAARGSPREGRTQAAWMRGLMLGDGGGGKASVQSYWPRRATTPTRRRRQQAGLAQAFHTDMFARGGGGSSSRGPRR